MNKFQKVTSVEESKVALPQKALKILNSGIKYTQSKPETCKNGKLVFMILGIVLAVITFITLVALTANRFHAQKDHNDITLILMVVGDNETQSLVSIKSFISSRGINQSNIFLGIQKQNIKLKQILGEQIRFFISQRYPYDLTFLEAIIKKVKTEYFYFGTTQWQLQNQFFFSYSKKFMKQFPTVAQIIPNEYEKLNRDFPILKPLGFSFAPGVHRTVDFSRLGGYYFNSLGQYIINYESQERISKIYMSKGLQAIVTNRFKIKRIDKKRRIDYLAKFSTRKIDNYVYPDQNFSTGSFESKVWIKRPPAYQNISSYVLQIQNSFRNVSTIYEVQKLNGQFKQLPFCVLVFPSQKYSRQQISDSIASQNFTNKRLVFVEQQLNTSSSYLYYQSLIQQKCIKNSLIMFLNSTIELNSLNYLNQIHQQNLAWVTYSKVQNKTFQVITFFSRIYQLFGKNDFDRTNEVFLQNNTVTLQAIGILQLCLDFSFQIQKQVITQAKQNLYLSASKKDSTPCYRTPYTKIHRLSQDIPTSIWNFDLRRRMIGTQIPFILNELSTKNMLRAAERQQQWYLPQNHTITQLQKLQYQQKFNINEYESIQKQVPFCLTVLSHNNIQNDRYIKVIKSIVQQEYSNYHIVFIDDNSTDQNMQKSIQYFKELKFPSERLTFVQNKKRNYATYNIINAAFNFCKNDEIQMLMDGDDEFVGKYAFQVINSAYQKNPDLWVVYSNYKNNYYEYGLSLPFRSENDHFVNNTRTFISNIGPIRTWRVKLLYNIPAKHHKMQNGQWLDTLYDDAIQHPLVELSTIKRVKYINEILYEYNTNYGENDNSNDQKIRHRLSTYSYITSLQRLSPLESLENSVKDKDIERQLLSGSDLFYTVLKNY